MATTPNLTRTTTQEATPSSIALRRLPRLALALWALTVGTTSCYNDNDFQLDQESGATSSRGGMPISTGGSATQAGTKSDGGAGGDGPSAPSYPPPKITSMDPTSGPYGTLVTIAGEGLGNPSMAGVTLALGDQGDVELTPDDKQAVVSWTDEEIVIRFPFPAEGPVAIQTPAGMALAGEFAPTWHAVLEIEQAPAATVLASVSPEPGHVQLLFDTMPLTLLDVSRDAALERVVSAPGVDPRSVRLYLNAGGLVEGVGISKDAELVLVHLVNHSGDLVAEPTAISLMATEFAVAGGSEGAAVWMNRADGWYRARPSGVTWKVDKGPIAEPNPSAADRAFGATSDGSLYLAHSEDASFLTDDMEAPYIARLAPTATQFASATRAGNAVDDYVTELTLTSSGDGLVVRVCGSDVDPFGFSGTDHYCYDGLHAVGGAKLFGVQVDAQASAHAFTHERAVAAYCTKDRSWFIRSDTDVEVEPGAPIGEAVLFPCPEAAVLEIDGKGEFLPVVSWAGRTYLLERNEAAAAP